jgi:hypothetical protein
MAEYALAANDSFDLSLHATSYRVDLEIEPTHDAVQHAQQPSAFAATAYACGDCKPARPLRAALCPCLRATRRGQPVSAKGDRPGSAARGASVTDARVDDEATSTPRAYNAQRAICTVAFGSSFAASAIVRSGGCSASLTLRSSAR